jgi:hypothetical protein
MARVRFNHNTFSTGVISKKVQGNTDFEKYNNALDECVNFQIQHTGGCFKRGGTYFLGETKNSGQAWLIPFVYSTDQSYICEFGEGYIRFYTRQGPLKNFDESIFEVATPFNNFKDISNFKYFQQGNVLFLLTPQGTFVLTRTGIDDHYFSLENTPLTYSFMPLTFMNTKNLALKPSSKALTAAITLTVVNPKGGDPDPAFAPLFFPSDNSSDSQVRSVVLNYMNAAGELKSFFFKITGVTAGTATTFASLTATIDKDLTPDADELPNDNPVQQWQVSAFSEERGIPVSSALYEGRLFMANNKSYPLGIWGSSVLYQDWFNFLPGSNPGDAVQNITSMDKSDEILWLVGQSKLFIGTRGGVYIGGAASYNDEAITPSSFRIRSFQSIGASSLQPITALDTVFFIDASSRNVHEIALTENATYQAYDLSMLANDLTQSGIIAHTWQQTPIKTYWCAVNDGYLCSLTYLKNNDILAWTKHIISGKTVRVTSLATIQEDRSDYVWMVVQREINGEIKRYIEYMHPMYDPLGQEEFKQFYVDSGITKQLKYTINKITNSENTSSKSRNARMTFDMAPFRTSQGFEAEYLLCFQGSLLDNDPLFKTKQIFTARNVSNDGFDLFFDTRFAGLDAERLISYKKINPLDYPNYQLPANFLTFLKFDAIRGVEITESRTFLHCNPSSLQDGDRVVLQNSGLREINNTALDGRMYSFMKDPNKPNGVWLTVSGTTTHLILNPASILDQKAEIFRRISSTTPIGLDLGTNCIVELKEAIPSSVQTLSKVYVNKVSAMTEINQKVYLIAWISADRKQLVLYDLEKSPEPHQRNQNLAVIDSSEYSEYDVKVENNGNCYLYFDEVEGLQHLVGQEVVLCVDGNKDNQGTIIVPANGKIPLPHPSMYCSVGLKMKSYLKLVPFSGGSVLGSSVGKVASQKDMAIYLYHSLGGRYGAESDETYAIPYRYEKRTKTDQTKSLFTGLIELSLPNSKNIYNRTIYIEHEDPLSFNVLSIAHESSVSDS